MIVYSFMPDYVNDFSDLLYGSIRLWLLGGISAAADELRIRKPAKRATA